MKSRIWPAIAVLLLAGGTVGCSQELEVTTADLTACYYAEWGIGLPEPYEEDILYYPPFVPSSPELQRFLLSPNYADDKKRYDRLVREVMGYVSNADDERLRSQTTIEGAWQRCLTLRADHGASW